MKSNETRKRKVESEVSINQPSTSGVVTKKVHLPQTDYPIPQREKDKQTMESNKLKAIELMKKSKDAKK